ncbi:hypothetical protein [Streptosporangium sp. KLBMP 9127]|nr:hypothetical protein [Streptosporangium sp. KLBMP 9127]
MTIDEHVREAFRDWSDDVRVPGDLASKAIRRRGRRRVKAGVAFAGAVAAVTALAFTVPSLIQDDGGRAVVAGPTSGELLTDPDSSPPSRLVAAGGVAVYAYYTWQADTTRERTWYLYDQEKKTYEKTPWDMLDVAPGGQRTAVLEQFPANRVGVISGPGAEPRWIELAQPAAGVRWSPDGRRLLVTTYKSDPDVNTRLITEATPLPETSKTPGGVPVTGDTGPNDTGPNDTGPNDEEQPRTGFAVVDVEQGTVAFVPLGHAAEPANRRMDLRWSDDGTLIWEPTVRPPYRNYYDLEGKPQAMPEQDTRFPDGFGIDPYADFPDGKPDTGDGMIVHAGPMDLSTFTPQPLKPIQGHHVESGLAWADDTNFVAWACEVEAAECVGGEFRNRLVLVNTDGSGLVPLTGFRENSQRPGSWEPHLSRR